MGNSQLESGPQWLQPWGTDWGEDGFVRLQSLGQRWFQYVQLVDWLWLEVILPKLSRIANIVTTQWGTYHPTSIINEMGCFFCLWFNWECQRISGTKGRNACMNILLLWLWLWLLLLLFRSQNWNFPSKSGRGKPPKIKGSTQLDSFDPIPPIVLSCPLLEWDWSWFLEHGLWNWVYHN